MMESISSPISNLNKKYVAFFDLDRTIIRVNSGKIMARHAYNKGLMSRMDLIRGVFLSLLFKLNLKDPVKIISTMVSWVKGASEASLMALSAEVFKAYILSSIYDDVDSEIKFHHNEGGGIVILSSTILPICKNIADHLGVDDVICSKLEVSNGIYTGHLAGPPCFGEEKVTRLLEYCDENNLNPEDSWYYGDAISDLGILSIVGNPVCINPDRKLTRAANQRGWKILHWH